MAVHCTRRTGSSSNGFGAIHLFIFKIVLKKCIGIVCVSVRYPICSRSTAQLTEVMIKMGRSFNIKNKLFQKLSSSFSSEHRRGLCLCHTDPSVPVQVRTCSVHHPSHLRYCTRTMYLSGQKWLRSAISFRMNKTNIVSFVLP